MTVWLLWDTRDYYSDHLVGVFAEQAAAVERAHREYLVGSRKFGDAPDSWRVEEREVE